MNKSDLKINGVPIERHPNFMLHDSPYFGMVGFIQQDIGDHLVRSDAFQNKVKPFAPFKVGDIVFPTPDALKKMTGEDYLKVKDGAQVSSVLGLPVTEGVFWDLSVVELGWFRFAASEWSKNKNL